jgi:hypothetical protein
VVANQTSNMKPYSYASIIDNTPPVVLSASVSPAVSTLSLGKASLH